MTIRHWHRCVAMLMACAAGGAWAQGSIFTCTGDDGREIRSDRPIPECSDRVQKELSSSGTIKRVVPPHMTAPEREAAAARERARKAEQRRAREEARRDRALLNRYPDAASHHRARAAALAQSDAVINAANEQISELMLQRKRLDLELEFYQNDIERAPAELRRSIEGNRTALDVAARLIADRMAERDRINTQFDAEAERLAPQWKALAGQNAVPDSSATTPR